MKFTAENVLASQEYKEAAQGLAKAGRFFAERGWSPATSSNYSVRLDEDWIAITRTGIDKFEIQPPDIIVVNNQGEVVAPHGQRSSAETLIHTAVYQQNPEIRSVLHTHSPQGTRLSLRFHSEGEIQFAGYEMQKGLHGQTTHANEISLPVLSNSQDMVTFSREVAALLKEKPDLYGFLMAGHGLYTWGRSLTEAKRHIETLEFLFACKTLELKGV